MGQEKNKKNASIQSAIRWVWALFIFAALGLAAALFFLIAQTANTQDLYTPYFGWLVTINISIAVLLLIALLWAGVRLAIRFRQRRFGSKLLVKLAAVFSLVGILPGLLVYAVSYQFVSRSIETWFDVKVEGALSSGLKLGQVSFDAQVKDLANKTQILSNQLSHISESSALAQIDRIRQQMDVEDVMLLTIDERVIGASGPASYRLNTERLTLAQRTELIQYGVISGIEDKEDGSPPNMWAVALVPPSIYDVTGTMRMLRVSASVPFALASHAQMVQEAYKEYQERALGRDGLRRMYIGTLTLALFLAVFGAVALAVMLGQQLIRPLLILVEGVKQVAQGDLSPKQLVHTHDELGGLTYAFAEMTTQLRQANEVANKSMQQVADARAHLQTILDNLTTGVIVLDIAGYVQTINPGAQRILRQNVQQGLEIKLEDIPELKTFGQQVNVHFSTLPDKQNAYWQETFELEVSKDTGTITIVARGAWLSETTKLVVIDDISDIISAQRSIAWGEVARRLAHEIKNPLTPIQLSAERMEHKFANKLDGPDRLVLEKSVKMIVDQVDAMKRLVNEFREYARLPVAELKPLDLNVIVHDIIQLYIGEQMQRPDLKIEAQLEPSLPMIKGDAAQLRQVLHNLMQNGLDAIEGEFKQKITIVTKYQCSLDGKQPLGRVCMYVQDSGCGFTEKTLKRAFEPYITTKAKGTGLGLAVVKKIMDEHGARIDLKNLIGTDGEIQGAQVLVSFPRYEDHTQALRA